MAILHGSWLSQVPLRTPNGESDTSLKSTTSLQTGGLFLWGEIWRRLTPAMLKASASSVPHSAGFADTRNYPYAMTPTELLEFLRSLTQKGELRFPMLEVLAEFGEAATPKRSRKSAGKVPLSVPPHSTDAVSWYQTAIALPSYLAEGAFTQPTEAIVMPQFSGAEVTSDIFLYPWNVAGILLSAEAAVLFLNSLPLGAVHVEDSFIGGDLRFWSHIVRWSLDLLARSKFLPGLELEAAIATWKPLLDSGVDQVRLMQFSEHMPGICRMYPTESLAGVNPLKIDLPLEPQSLLQDFLQNSLDAQIRAVAKNHPLPEISLGNSRAKGATAGTIASPVREWLQALGQPSGTVEATGLESLQTSLQTWIAPLQLHRAESVFRTCLYLHAPQPGQTDWQLEYFLQAADNEEFLIDAPTIWNNPVEQFYYQGRAIAHPQETFLMGLGLASRLYSPIEPSLQAPHPQFCTITPIQAYEFLKTTAWRLQDSGIGVIVPASLASQGGWANRLGLKIQAETAKPTKGKRLGLQSLLNFRWELTIGGQSISKEEFDRLVALNTPLVEINGEWVELRPQDIRAAQSFFASRKDQPSLSLEDALRISTGDTQMIEKLPVVSFEASGALEDLINTLSGKRTLEPIPAPKGFRGELRPYQARGVGWLSFLEQWSLGACLADDMGLGKTIQLIAFLLHLQEQNVLENPTLLVCPTSVLGNWEREVKKFGPSLKVLQHHGDGRPKGKDFAKAVKGKHLVITSYALAQRDLKDLQTIPWQGIVLDEAQNIKNPEAKQSQAVRQIEAQFRIALTGTPVENRLTELWSILDFLNPGYLGPKNFFQRRFATPIERYGDTASLQTLKSLVQPFILRRLKTDKDIIQDLPEKQEMAVFCGLSEEQASLYQHMVEKSLQEIEASEGIQRKGIILALLTKLKQICNHPDLFLKAGEETGNQELKHTTRDSFQNRSGKLKRLEEMLEEVMAEGDRALIFTQFAEWGKRLQAHLEEQFGREVLFLYGGTSKKQREEMVDRFQHDPQGPRLFILSLKAGGVGLNLTRANHVFHYDRWWNPAVENQATDRVFRIGQTRNVQVHKFVCSGTLEEKIHDLIESKKALAEQVVGAGENWLTELNTDQLRDLLLLDRSAIIGEE
ncbi:DNA/RNA helicase, superfamily II, SNF2 family [Leptolyngbyaceae cyanobacterium JSC-12]|nr:DNA/RNA helicase, superfamily II, SNF2 family [Leptolyngbyaceae cyanobacterium JSC-12]